MAKDLKIYKEIKELRERVSYAEDVLDKDTVYEKNKDLLGSFPECEVKRLIFEQVLLTAESADKDGTKYPFYADEISAGRWDDFRHHLEKAKYTWNDPAAARAVANRDMLRRLMEQAGFTALEHEWWHFNLPDKEKYPLIDFSLWNGQPVFTEK